ncbi:hypothetical protein [Streptomyces geranii]|uniref:hypothetical protein n=1 Tax=Streptomyces geranii TaxID=2058923 RepID=UPI000D0381C1|nr:hypothetical protein [Streptomyces geranii]
MGLGCGHLKILAQGAGRLHELPTPPRSTSLAEEFGIRLPIALAIRREAVTHPAVRTVWTALRHEVAERAAELLPE